MRRARGIYCNRTLNLRAIRAVGYDLDYTLVHYHTDAWEQRAYQHVRTGLAARGMPVADLAFDAGLVAQGLILDTERGNIVKADRFGYVKQAAHGTTMLPWDTLRQTYARTFVDLREPRWHFLNTLFAVSESTLYLQLVDRLDAGTLSGVMSYPGLYELVKNAVGEAHTDGLLKAEIREDPDAFVDLDPEMPLALLDQKKSGKTVLLITNSGFQYGAAMLSHAMDPFLPDDLTWRDVFDLAFFAARKPDFFSVAMPVFEVVDDQGLLRPHVGPVERGGVYVGGNAALVEDSLGLEGEEILYVGDHVFADVNVTKNLLRWRTALVLRSLESEMEAIEAFAPRQAEISRLMAEKTALETQRAALRLARQRLRKKYGPQPKQHRAEIQGRMDALRKRMEALDREISPLASAAGELANKRWGPPLRAGNDKSHLARQVERYADIYTSRVSNFLHHTPYLYLRASRGSLPHDP
ncbi:MAG: HAD-IG family 5'-nucleotidase [Deltaproteobacteria bacterium]|nr:HAD-IG family 5'-nucleotidase [Deltaproteobacteria bacterium]